MARITNSNPISLTNLGRGEAVKRFDLAVGRVLADIKNPATSTTKKREIVLKVVFTPSPDRDGADFTATVKANLAGEEPYSSQVVIGETIDGKAEAHESILILENEQEIPEDI